MGSGYFGEPNLGNEKSYSSSSSSRKSKKSNSDKPKQPQRGLGVAQLEKIRLHSQMGCTYNPFATNLNQVDMRRQTPYSSISYSSSSSSSYGFPAHQSIMMGLGDIERANIRYGDSQPPSTASTWHPGTVYEPQPNMTRCLLNLQVEDSLEKRRKKDRSDSIGSSSQNSELNGSQELDLELRLSL
ncbi:protein SPEAR3-like [Nicotiana tomentosiformis]|uniref:protein SPEAR3-like n=1 Tax=Nicotiana tomentosiformis TaxID=4098 RepID=UPI00051BE492